MAAVFVDYDGTITDIDTFDVLVRRAAGADAWTAFERKLDAGHLTLRETLAGQAALIRATLDEADELLSSEVRFDPTFGAFAERVTMLGHSLAIVSSGVAPLIRRALERNALAHLELIANEVEVLPSGWRLVFRGDSDNGTDKAALVEAARARGDRTVYIGDGWSDVDAALKSDLRYVKRGRTLERYLTARDVPFLPFSRFSEIDPAGF